MTLSYPAVKQTYTSRNAQKTRGLDLSGLLRVLILLALHVPLGLGLYRYPDLSTLHAYIVFGIGLYFAFTGRLQYVIYVAAYIVGAEVLWRMTHADIFWEFGKYSISLLLLMALLRGRSIRNPGLPMLYFLLLVPSTILTVENLGGPQARDELSFNLSGPFSLTICTLFFSGRKMSIGQLYQVFFFVIAPIVSIASIAAFTTFTAPKIYFGDESNPVTSGGYGPNQVSAMLGIAALICFLYLVSPDGRKALKAAFLPLLGAFGAQAALTFSRGGLYLAFVAAVAGAVFVLRDVRSILRYAIVACVVAGLAVFLVWPRLHSFTRGAIETRFEDTGGTGRLGIIKDDIRIWKENYIIGVGPGRAKAFRYSYHQGALAHTEMTRMLAEHGLPGLFAIGVLLVMAFRSVFRKPNPEGKALSASLVVWSICFMLVNAMRLVAPSFLFGLASADLGEEEQS
jgi:O-Antigen ligase